MVSFPGDRNSGTADAQQLPRHCLRGQWSTRWRTGFREKGSRTSTFAYYYNIGVVHSRVWRVCTYHSWWPFMLWHIIIIIIISIVIEHERIVLCMNARGIWKARWRYCVTLGSTVHTCSGTRACWNWIRRDNNNIVAGTSVDQSFSKTFRASRIRMRSKRSIVNCFDHRLQSE